MHMAASTGNLAELKLVIEFAPERINETDSDGLAPLHCAASWDQESAISLLLSAKADVNKTNYYGQTPLDYAEGDRVKQLLIDAGGHE